MKNCNEKVFVGVDCHKESIACFVNGNFKEFKTNLKGYKKALEWVKKQNSNSAWALEGAYSYGLTFSKFLLESGCEVYEFNALATAKARKALSISGAKNDFGDAKVISIFAKHLELKKVSLKTVKLKELITARKNLVGERTRVINFLKSSFVKSGAKPPFESLKTQKACNWLKNQDEKIYQVMGTFLETCNNSIKELENEIEKETPEKAKKLENITGIGTLTASTLYAETKGKTMTKAQFASYCGVAPVECSSGLSTNFRNNKRGNRTLNSILYSISLLQSRYDKIGAAYFEKKMNEGKSKRHARKCLARRLTDIIYKVLFND